MKTLNGFSVETVKDFGGVLALRDAWQRLIVMSANRRRKQGHVMDPAVDIDFYLTEMRAGNESVRPHVIVLKRDGVPWTILPGRIEKRPLQESFGYKKFSTHPVRILTLIHCGMLGEDSEEHATILLDFVKRCLREGEADVAWLYGMESDSFFYQVAKNERGFFTRDRCPALMQRWRIRLPKNYNELLQQLSANARHNLKRYSRRLRDAFGDQIAVRSFRNPSEVGKILSDTEAIAAKTYQRGLGVGFSHTAGMAQRMTFAANRGWLRAHILYRAGDPVAYWNGSLYHRTFFTWTTGYDPTLGHLRPGTFVLQSLLQELCSEDAADSVDFGFGDAQYKRDWCDQEHCQASMFLFAPTLRGVCLNMFHSSLTSASHAARNLLARTEVLARLKKAWRRRLAQKANGVNWQA
jgi:hypothetical protein